MSTKEKAAKLQKELTDKGVKYCIGAYVDIHGVPKAKVVPIDHLGHMAKGSERYTGYALDGLGQAPNDDELTSVPDLDSVIQLPWEPKIAWMAADNHFQGKLSVPDAEDKLTKSCYDVRGFTNSFSWLDKMATAINGLDWDLYSFDHEDANGQFEFDFNYADAVTSCDRLIFFRYMAKHYAKEEGLLATMMPKPFADKTGNAAHFNMSLYDLKNGSNLFACDPKDDPRGIGLTPLGYMFIGGILKHGRALCAVFAPTVNSYKRLVRRGAMSYFTWAPVFNSYGSNNRTNSVRVPSGGGRCESRNADGAVNPYLAAALVLAAGLEGIREGLDPGNPNEDNLYDISEAERAKRGIEFLPQTLQEAVAAFAADPLVEQALGKELKDEFIRYKTAEWEEYHLAVSKWEVERYSYMF